MQAQDFTAKASNANSRARSIAFVALSIAIIAVSAWVTVPIGPVPITLQMFSVSFAILVLTPKQCIASIAGYLLLGAVGVPVFSGMRGGIGVLAGPTGGYLWGYLLGVSLAVLILLALRRVFKIDPQGESHRALAFGVDLAACLVFVLVAYVCGWAQFMAVTGTGPLAAFVATVAPFIVIDVLKCAAAVIAARAVRAVVR